MTDEILVGAGDRPAVLLPRFANRHGLIAGATGTGKTVTLQALAEAFSAAGTPVFVSDIKGDLSGVCQPGAAKDFVVDRWQAMGLPTDDFRAAPTVFWDLFGKRGHPIRVTVSDIGPMLLGRLLELNDTQTGVLNIAFALADDEGLLLLDLKDLRAMLGYVSEQKERLTVDYGNVSPASVGAIQRRLLELETEGVENFLGEPALDLNDLLRTDRNGHGFINLLAAEELMQRPRLYATFLVWLLSELFETLPEVGDLAQPKLVLFFDEAHLLFDDAPKALIDKIEQVVRLIRSKGVGVYFVTQNPLDVPESVLGQLGNRIQHALRAFTPRDQKAVRAAAQTFRPNPRLNTERVIGELAVGEALVSFLDADGTPTVVERVKIKPPHSRIGPATDAERTAVMRKSPVRGVYDQTLDRVSAYERLKGQTAKATANRKGAEPARRQGKSAVDKMIDSAVSEASRTVGQKIVRGLLGTILKW